MNQTRGFLYIILAVLSFLLFQAYFADTAPKPAEDPLATSIASTSQSDEGNVVSISNGLIKLSINSKSGDIVAGELLTYNRQIESNEPLPLVSDRKNGYLRIINGLYGANGTDSDKTRANYEVVSTENNSVTLKFVKDNVTYVKKISLFDNSYEVKVDYNVTNNSSTPISLAPYSSFKHTRDASSSLFSTNNEYGTNNSYAGIIISTDNDNYEKLSYGDIQDGDFAKRYQTNSGWVAISQHFFVTAYVPQNNVPFQFNATSDGNFYFINARTDLQTVNSGTTKEFSDKYWIGPKDQKALAGVAKDLDLVVDYGWAWFLSLPLYKLMMFLKGFIANWGVTIIVLTLLVRLIILPLSILQFRNQALMRVIQPEIALANERAGEDRMRKLQETQKVFQKYGASQFTGCLPALIQLPIFLALFYLMNEAVELRHQPFFGWIKDLSAVDPYYVLPIINGLTMVYLFSLTPMPDNMDPLQKKVMKLMPYTFMLLLMFLPSGLILYYIVSNLVTILLIKYFSNKISKQYANGTLPTYSAKESKFAKRLAELQKQQEELARRKK